MKWRGCPSRLHRYQSAGIAGGRSGGGRRCPTLEQLILIAEQTSIAVMLVGRAELVGMLVRSVPEQVCDAITRYVALEPLDAVQTAEFVAHCLGEETSPVTCGDDAFRRIVAHSHGVPGTIDRLMTDALRLARLSRSARLTATVIDMIADDEHPPGGRAGDGTPERRYRPSGAGNRSRRIPPHATGSSPRSSTAHQRRSHPVDADDSHRSSGKARFAPYEDDGRRMTAGDPGRPDDPRWPKSSANLRRRRPARHAGFHHGRAAWRSWWPRPALSPFSTICNPARRFWP